MAKSKHKRRFEDFLLREGHRVIVDLRGKVVMKVVISGRFAFRMGPRQRRSLDRRSGYSNNGRRMTINQHLSADHIRRASELGLPAGEMRICRELRLCAAL
jgi:hypothetical protein